MPSIADRSLETEPCECCHDEIGGVMRWRKNKTRDLWGFVCDKCGNGGFADE